MAVSMRDLLADLAAETQVLDAILSRLGPAEWEIATPAAGWAIRDQVSHLAYFDEAALVAATDPQRFGAVYARLASTGPGLPDLIAARYRRTQADELLVWFRRARGMLLDGFADLPPDARLPWYGPQMSTASSITARLMETWAHGQDVADALAVHRQSSARLRHIAHLGVRTFGYSFSQHGRAVPPQPVRVALAAPGGETWSWGPGDAVNVVHGPAEDFCLVVTRRRHVDDTALEVQGAVAREWMLIAQAYAGAPGSGRAPTRLATPGLPRDGGGGDV